MADSRRRAETDRGGVASRTAWKSWHRTAQRRAAVSAFQALSRVGSAHYHEGDMAHKLQTTGPTDREMTDAVAKLIDSALDGCKVDEDGNVDIDRDELVESVVTAVLDALGITK